jgi:non-lysosomal glucosylceramidase
MEKSAAGQPCDSSHCGCGVPRRDFLQFAGIGALAVLLRNVPAMAGPFETADFQRFVPEDKKLSPQWVKSLFERGEPTIYRGTDLKYIGMPIGGLTCGQLYLGGDGKLWHWDIFNQIFHTGDHNYANPVEPNSPLQQGFSIVIGGADGSTVRKLDASGFSDVSFKGQYPIGTVEYRDAGCPVAVTLEAFSPFIPLDTDASSVPVTIQQFTLKNTGSQRVDVDLTAHLENAIGLYSDQQHEYVRKNETSRQENRLLLLNCSADAPRSASAGANRETIVFEDFEGTDYGKWTVAGTAFGKGPMKGNATAENLTGYLGNSLVNSYATSDVAGKADLAVI